MHYLYRHFNSDNVLLYVGISLNHLQRLSQHKQISNWYDEIARIEIEQFPDRESAIEAENKAIIKENPLHNKKGKSWDKEPENDYIETIDRADESRLKLIKNYIEFHPLYRLQEISGILNIPNYKVKLLIEKKQLGCIKMGTRTDQWGTRDILYITGWQLIDFVEGLQAGTVDLPWD